MKKTIAAWMAVVLVFASAGSLVAHHSLAQFDTTKAVTVKGTIVQIELVNPHTILFLDQKAADGQIHRWAVEGPSISQLTRIGFYKDGLRIGDVIEACGYVAKEGVELERAVFTEPLTPSAKASLLKSVSGRLMDGEMLVKTDGQKLKWSDYGQHLCLGPNYHNFHK